MGTVFDAFSSDIDHVFSGNPSVNLFVFGALMFFLGTGFPFLMDLIDMVNYLISPKDLTQVVNFSTQIFDSGAIVVMRFWVYF